MTKMNSAVENMQFKIKEIRTLFGVSVTKFSLMMGVTRQTVYNIENFKTQLAQVQFLAICTLLNNLLEAYPEKESALIAIWERDFDKIKRRHNNRGLIF
ncbi:MAG: helix-turn-helix transcriptional regulator [Clostridia bacterium]|nr:helix-turn-helix transcriptional regulator [Clostridia bacterium]